MNILGGTAVGSLAAIVSALLYCDKFFCGTMLALVSHTLRVPRGESF